MSYLTAEDVHQRLGGPGWRQVLEQLVPAAFLTNSHGPCPACGGKDRYRFDNRRGRGDYYCNGCGAGDGFKLVMKVCGMGFADAKARVIQLSGMSGNRSKPKVSGDRDFSNFEHRQGGADREKPGCNGEFLNSRNSEISRPPARIFRVLRECCAIEDCRPVVEYLQRRALWPLAPDRVLRAHAGLEYFEGGRSVGRFPALVAPVLDADDELVTVHVTYLERTGIKLVAHEPRKLLSGLVGRRGCAVRLARPTDGVLGVAEGIETALAAAEIHGMPTWAVLNTALLARFDAPADVAQLSIYADRDVAGLEAAARLLERLQGRAALELRSPPAPAKDWADVLEARRAQAAA